LSFLRLRPASPTS